MPLTPEYSAAIRDLLRAGNKILAIKIYREATGVGLAEAKEYIEKIAESMSEDEAAPPRLGEAIIAVKPGAAPDWLEVKAALRAGQKIEAIKRYREAVPGAGLAEAKTFVERLAVDMRITGETIPDGMPVSAPLGCGMAVMIFLVVLALSFGVLALVLRWGG